ncbi:MAG TPA: sigma-70 family RNA polymerase sigma factor [Candidatus Limnocylindria bacterium]|nr:sigma-70 family RNA polymerase sigma factor [Candidatus Limnocylindria bacterium]
MADAGAHKGGPPPVQEAALVARVRQGELSAFEELIRPYERRVYRGILRITRDPTEAADVYQETLLAAFEKFDAFRGEAAFGSWLHRIAVNCALMRHRARKHAPVVLEEDLPKFDWRGMHARPVEDWAESAEAPARRAQLRAALDAALDALPEVDRAIVWLKDAEGESHENIAAATGLTVSATRSRLHRARLLLRARLEKFAGGDR